MSLNSFIESEVCVCLPMRVAWFWSISFSLLAQIGKNYTVNNGGLQNYSVHC